MHVNPLKGKEITFLLCQIQPELKNRFMLKEVYLICWGIIKVKILYEISGMKFSPLELN